MAAVASVIYYALLLFFILLLARLVLDYVQVFARSWHPRGVMLVAAEVIYTVTDPPIRLFRRLIPPLRVGAIAIDFGFALTMLLCFILLAVTRSLAL